MLGQKVKTLIDNQTMKAGSHEIVWDATNAAGDKVATGMYIYSLKFGNFSKNMKMMLVK
jgi:flagellar hook assembly protein FlgD